MIVPFPEKGCSISAIDLNVGEIQGKSNCSMVAIFLLKRGFGYCKFICCYN